MAPFYEWGSIASRLHNHYDETVLYFTTKSPEIFGTLLTRLGRMKD